MSYLFKDSSSRVESSTLHFKVHTGLVLIDVIDFEVATSSWGLGRAGVKV